MADYAAAPSQVIAHGLITIDAAGDPMVTGRGFSIIERGVGLGNFILTFDAGVVIADIGSGSVTNAAGFGYPDGTVGPYALDPRKARIAMTMRGGTTAPGATTISPLSASFIMTPGEGSTQIQVVPVNVVTDAATDPMGHGVANADGGGLEIIVWYGGATPDDATQQAFGPLYQSAMMFP